MTLGLIRIRERAREAEVTALAAFSDATGEGMDNIKENMRRGELTGQSIVRRYPCNEFKYIKI